MNMCPMPSLQLMLLFHWQTARSCEPTIDIPKTWRDIPFP